MALSPAEVASVLAAFPTLPASQTDSVIAFVNAFLGPDDDTPMPDDVAPVVLAFGTALQAIWKANTDFLNLQLATALSQVTAAQAAQTVAETTAAAALSQVQTLTAKIAKAQADLGTP